MTDRVRVEFRGRVNKSVVVDAAYAHMLLSLAGQRLDIDDKMCQLDSEPGVQITFGPEGDTISETILSMYTS